MKRKENYQKFISVLQKFGLSEEEVIVIILRHNPIFIFCFELLKQIDEIKKELLNIKKEVANDCHR